ncbi:PAS domain S-box protein [Desulfobulbus alkaliphilus]|uniref:PAS domain S-box protein n=1 Tax=Desulfobulbus alkaliphilus TaxID=869814 RepID=UPI0019654CB2|nr:PAS domain S-box protein [Desulfobulbus alkaliphilus]MBM9537822.1 PAS domain S-box protein [Desulfobulbus alkaliphilus]
MPKSTSSRTAGGPLSALDLQNIFDNAPIGIFSSTPEGRYIAANPATASMLGYESPEDLIESVTDIATQVYADPIDRGEFMRLMEEQGEVCNHECRFCRKDGTELWVSRNVRAVRADDGQIVAYQGFNTDVTESKKAAEALRASEAKVKSILEGVPVLQFVIDRDHRVIFWNSAIEDYSGISAADIIGTDNHWSAFYPEKRPVLADLLVDGNIEQIYQRYGGKIRQSRYIKGAYEATDFFPFMGASGTWLTFTAAPIRDAQGNVIGAVETLEDITERKRAVEALQINEEFRKRVFESSRIPIVVMDVETFQYLDCNPAAVAIYGYNSKEETIGKTPLDVSALVQYDGTPSEEKALFYIKQALDRGSVVFEWLHKRPGGELWDAEVHLQSFNVAGRKMMQFSLVDITDRKRAEEALKSSVSLLAATLESTEDGILTVNRAGRVEQWNARFLDLWRIPKEMALEGDDEKLLQYVAGHVQNSEEFFARVKSLYDNPEEISFDVIALADGRWLERYSQPRRLDGEIIGRVWSFRDITDRTKAEQELRRSEARYRSIIAMSNTGAWEYHQNTDYLWCSPEYFTMLGRDPDEFQMDGRANLSEVWTNLIHPDDRQAASERFAEYLRRGSVGIYENSFRFQGADGEWVWIWSRGQTLRNTDKSVTDLTVGTHIDITDRKRAEEERVKLQEQLIQAQKMETVGRLAGGVAHDFNNMLGVILGYSEMALEQVPDGHPIYKAVHRIQQAAQRSADLTRQLLAFARKQPIAPRVIDLNETVAGMLSMLRRLIGEDIALIWLPGRDLYPINMDPAQIDQILANLCINARDAIEGPGKVTIKTGMASCDEAWCAVHTGAAPGEYVLLIVSDSGRGMDQETISHLFEPFFTTKEQGQGTGLGLASVYGAVTQNNGFITVDSEPGQGTTFTIYLQRYTEIRTEPLPQQVPVEVAARGHETILLVEDEPATLDMTSIMLERQGYTVLAAGSPEEAIRLAGEYSGRIDLLMTDVIMPGMNGRALAENLLTRRPDIKCLFMSGYTADIIVHHGVLDQGVHFIQKPFSIKELGTKLREVMDE